MDFTDSPKEAQVHLILRRTKVRTKGMTESSETSVDDYALLQLKQRDRERYIQCLFAPAKVRQRIACLFALNQELSQIADHVREPMIGTIRLQWWQEALSDLSKGTHRGHPLLKALLDAFGAGYAYESFFPLIEGREALFDDKGLSTAEAIQTYAEDVGGSLSVIAGSIAMDADLEIGLQEPLARIGTAEVLAKTVFHLALEVNAEVSKRARESILERANALKSAAEQALVAAEQTKKIPSNCRFLLMPSRMVNRRLKGAETILSGGTPRPVELGAGEILAWFWMSLTGRF